MRRWYASPKWFGPGATVPGVFLYSPEQWTGPDPQEMKLLKGPYPTAAEAQKAAQELRSRGKRSPIYLLGCQENSSGQWEVRHCWQHP